VEPTKPKLPSEAIEFYNDFIRGEIDVGIGSDCGMWV